MPMIPAEVIEEARKMDVLTWLQQNDPDNLVKLSNNQYTTKEHDSLKISNGMWYWWSRGFGGRSALDYLTKVKGYSFPEAVEAITGKTGNDGPSFSKPGENPEQRAMKPKADRELRIPALERNPEKARAYLLKRGITENVIDFCFRRSLLFETSYYHSILFVGYDKDGIARYGAIRGTTNTYKGEVKGSNKQFSFSVTETPDTENLHVFESAIDLLSFASLAELTGIDWKKEALLSLGGVTAVSQNGATSKEVSHTGASPAPLMQYLADHPQIKKIHLHLDNDEPGRLAAAAIVQGLDENYEVLDEPPVYGKDVNEMLMKRIEKSIRREEPER